jgi:hypothetical protein
MLISKSLAALLVASVCGLNLYSQNSAACCALEEATEKPAPPTVPEGEAFVRPVIVPSTPRTQPYLLPQERQGVDWKGLLLQSGEFLALQHSFRLLTEQGTRDAFKGPYLAGYADAAGGLHGWGDGDEFYVNYVGHPLQGAIAASIWVHNDRDYNGAELGRNSLYWKSRLRALAYSFAYSAQFEIGAVSEASIGKVQRDYPQQGYVDLVVTPVIGLGWVVAEDTIDKYFLQYVERRWSNPHAIALLRTWLTPSKSMANVLALQVPWRRMDRPGPYTHGELQSFLDLKRSGRIAVPKRPAPPERIGPYGIASFEFSPSFNANRYWGSGQSSTCLGGGGEMAAQVARSWQLVLDVNGCTIGGMTEPWSGDVMNFAAGPRWTPRASGKLSPFVQVLTGGTLVTQQMKLPGFHDDTGLVGREYFDYINAHLVELQDVSFAVRAKSGLDLRINPAFAVRLASLEYSHSWVSSVGGRSYGNGVSLTTGVVLRTGTW